MLHIQQIASCNVFEEEEKNAINEDIFFVLVYNLQVMFIYLLRKISQSIQ